MSQSKLEATEIIVGQALRWCVYNIDGLLLLNKNYIIRSQRQLEVLLEIGLYRNKAKEQKEKIRQHEPVPIEPINGNVLPFESIVDNTNRLKALFTQIENKHAGVGERILQLSADIRTLCTKDLDAALGIVHLVHDIEYTAIHPIHTAILSDLIAQHLGYDKDLRQLIIAANLTSNIGMLKLQARLYHQSTPLTLAQHEEIKAHPARAVAMLKEVGIDNELWLTMIMQHHECIDGSGYLRLKEAEVIKEAEILALSDRYAAMVSPRETRNALLGKECLMHLFVDRGKQYDEELSLLFIKLLGVYPPGSIVQLNNNETAVVIGRPVDNTKPLVKSFLTPLGSRYTHAKYRDCNDDKYAIKNASISKVPNNLNLNELWSYVEDEIVVNDA